MELEEFLKEAAVMKEIKHPNLVQLLGKSCLLFPAKAAVLTVSLIFHRLVCESVWAITHIVAVLDNIALFCILVKYRSCCLCVSSQFQ